MHPRFLKPKIASVPCILKGLFRSGRGIRVATFCSNKSYNSPRRAPWTRPWPWLLSPLVMLPDPSMPPSKPIAPWMIYGANGYTGRLVVAEAKPFL